MFSEQHFRSRLSAARSAKGLTKRSLALRINVSERAVGQFEQGHSLPAIGTLAAIGCALDVSVDYLLGLSDDPRRR